MRMHSLLLTFSLVVSSLPARAHDEGHGPKLSDTGKFGGLVTAVVEKKEANLGSKAKLQYKAELVRSPAGKVQLYLYDAEFKPIDASGWDKKGQAIMAAKKKGKWLSQEFELTYDGKAFTGQMPELLGKPFNLDFLLKDKDKELLTAFDNLD